MIANNSVGNIQKVITTNKPTTVSTTMKGYVNTKQMLLARFEKSLRACRHRGRSSSSADVVGNEGVMGSGMEGETGEGGGGGILMYG